ncbi:hypothetical protein ACIBTV_26650 [Micromonospora sp. NPDC049366]|uniref:hypothetical protein n=1 Tax=Micromonospora sp. NPDC049366 TaxID=3364271 RepID=UPI0037BCA259
MTAVAEPELPFNRERMVFAKAISLGCVSEWPRGTGSETRRRRIGGNNNLARPSFLRCKKLADAFAAAGLADRPTQNLPADWKLTEAGEAWLVRARAEIECADT